MARTRSQSASEVSARERWSNTPALTITAHERPRWSLGAAIAASTLPLEVTSQSRTAAALTSAGAFAATAPHRCDNPRASGGGQLGGGLSDPPSAADDHDPFISEIDQRHRASFSGSRGPRGLARNDQRPRKREAV